MKPIPKAETVVGKGKGKVGMTPLSAKGHGKAEKEIKSTTVGPYKGSPEKTGKNAGEGHSGKNRPEKGGKGATESKGSTEKGAGKQRIVDKPTQKFPVAPGKAAAIAHMASGAVPKSSSGAQKTPAKSAPPVSKATTGASSGTKGGGKSLESKGKGKSAEQSAKASGPTTNVIKVKGGAKGSNQTTKEADSSAPVKGSTKGEGKANASGKPTTLGKTALPGKAASDGKAAPRISLLNARPITSVRPVGTTVAPTVTTQQQKAAKVVRACKCGSIRAKEYWKALATQETYCSACWEKIQVRTPTQLGLLLGLEDMQDLGVILPITV